jgi:transcriptional regulator with XRE-family HTH domain
MDVLALTATFALVAGTSPGRKGILELLPPGTSYRNTFSEDEVSKPLQKLIKSGSRPHNINIELEETTGGFRYRFVNEVNSPTSTDISIDSVASMLSKVKSVFALSVSDVASVLGVERPTIYAWMAARATPHTSNLERLRTLFNLAKESEPFLTGLTDKQIKNLQVQDTSLIELLSQIVIPRDLFITGLESIKMAIEQDVGKPKAKGSLKDLAKKHGIPLPSKEASKDTFDLVTGKRTDPELE